MVLGKHSGRHALKQRIRDLGYHLDDQQLQNVFDGFKALADRKKSIYDADIEALAESALNTGPAIWTLEAITCSGGSGSVPHAAVVLWHKDGTLHREASMGDGPVDAVFKTIERITGVEIKLKEFQVRSVTVGEDAQGEAQVEAEHQGRIDPRPSRQHRHHRSQRPGVFAGHQSGAGAGADEDEPADGSGDGEVKVDASKAPNCSEAKTLVSNASRTGWKHTLVNESLSKVHAIVEIDAKRDHGGSADGSSAHEAWALPAEMPVPLLTARIKEGHDPVRFRVDAG